MGFGDKGGTGVKGVIIEAISRKKAEERSQRREFQGHFGEGRNFGPLSQIRAGVVCDGGRTGGMGQQQYLCKVLRRFFIQWSEE